MKRSPRRLFAFRGFAAARLAAAIALFAALSGAAFAQGYDCAGLRAQIAGLDRSNARANPYAGTIRSQRAGLQRTADYAHKIGCDRQQFIFFGSPPPAQCGQINAQIAQLRASLAQLEGSARGMLDSPQRRQMVASYNAYCRQQTATQGGFLGGLFGGPTQQSNEPDIADVPSPDALPATDQPGQPTGGSEMLCVRHCDGAFFPITDAPGRDQETLSDFCKASCPNAEVSVYSRVPGQVIQTAVGLDGKAYMSLPAALKYQKSLDASCTCRAQGATWGDTLAGAEAMLSHSKKGEFVVTQEKSDEMARPTAATPDKKKKRAPVPAADDTSDQDIIDQDAAAAAQVPTASTDSAGISAGNVKNQSSYPQGAGQTTEITTPEGVKQRVRIVGPQP
ncbi:uncharacterized protein DUF2865 [Methylovirgula ligni]|uniref:Uncharacterized protein DUF2865 n=1 Tax=Methylovirgula ligni TaxID=569860 RepID=A0A3D9Z114_9HYPH|nr:DUF2865 domain-containing protein [Methylovirgula ligni]REF87700.1 uncharacterized protein DUF2865 [Methylovirgula ligni]